MNVREALQLAISTQDLDFVLAATDALRIAILGEQHITVTVETGYDPKNRVTGEQTALDVVVGALDTLDVELELETDLEVGDVLFLARSPDDAITSLELAEAA